MLPATIKPGLSGWFPVPYMASVVRMVHVHNNTAEGKDDGLWELYDRVAEMKGLFSCNNREYKVFFHLVHPTRETMHD
jgi:hypothetical protein